MLINNERTGMVDQSVARRAQPRQIPVDQLSGGLTQALAGLSDGSGVLFEGDNLALLQAMESDSVQMVYIDPPFNTGKTMTMRRQTARKQQANSVAGSADGSVDSVPAPPQSSQSNAGERAGARANVASGADTATKTSTIRAGFQGANYETAIVSVLQYNDQFADYWGFLEPRLLEIKRILADTGTLYLHLDYREAHYAKVLLDAIFGRDCFLNEIIWAYDYGARAKRKWPAKHDTILVYVKNPKTYYFDNAEVDREPYMAPGLVTAEKLAKGKLPTDVWWHTIVPTNSKERTGYPTQKPEGILRRMIAASSRPGDLVVDVFAGSGTTGAVAAGLGRKFLLADQNPEAVEVISGRLGNALYDRICIA